MSRPATRGPKIRKMSSKGKAKPRVLDPRLRLAITQRDVFDWFVESPYNGGDVYSPQWQCRLEKWDKEFEKEIDLLPLHAKVSRCEEEPEKLNIGLLFQTHPVAAFSLWHLLQACYKLDRLICGNSTPIAEWQDLLPFEYLNSTDIMSVWRKNLKSFSSRVRKSNSCNDNFLKEAVASQLHKLVQGVQALEEACKIACNVFETRKATMPCSSWMLEHIQESVNQRCCAIQSISDSKQIR